MNIYNKLHVLLEKTRQENSVLRLLGHSVKRRKKLLKQLGLVRQVVYTCAYT